MLLNLYIYTQNGLNKYDKEVEVMRGRFKL